MHSISESENKQALHVSTTVVFLRSMEQIYVPTEASSKVLDTLLNVNSFYYFFTAFKYTKKDATEANAER